MKTYVIASIIGICFGLIDIIPMIMQKLPKRASISAFIHYFFVSLTISFIDLPGIIWWLEGPSVALCLAIPIIVIASEKDNKSIYIISTMSVVLGYLISLVNYLF